MMLRSLLGNAPGISFRVGAGLFKRVLPNEPNFPPDSHKTKTLLAAKRTNKTNPLNPIHGKRLLPPQGNTR